MAETEARATHAYLRAFVTRKRGGIRADWTDWVTYGYLMLGVVVMLAPVLWVALSSFKSETNLTEFPPTLPETIESWSRATSPSRSSGDATTARGHMARCGVSASKRDGRSGESAGASWCR
jgi:ABC-type glycerol-3-phosphate transport system permease component